MASRVQLMAICDKLKATACMDDMASIITDYPELFFSQLGIVSIMQAIPKVLERSKEQDVSYYFIRSIINGHRTKMMGGYSFDNSPLKDAFNGYDHDWANHILATYIRELIERSEGYCLSGESIMKKWDPNLGNQLGISSPYAYLGWILFGFDYTSGNLLNDRAFESFAKHINHNGDFFAGFFEIFCGCCSCASGEAISLLTDFFRLKEFYYRELPYERESTDGKSADKTILHHLMKCDVAWLQEEVTKEHAGKFNHYMLEEITDVWVTLAGALQNYFTTVNFFYEYISEIAYFYPLSKERADVAERYARYFGDEAINYMADITSSVIEHVSKLDNYRDKQMERPVTRLVLMDIEKIILDIKLHFPDVSPDVVRLFLRDTYKAFGRGFKGYSEGLAWHTDEIVNSVWHKDEVAQESMVDFLTLLPSLEADMDEGGAEDITGNSALHQKASTNKTGNAMKTAERKVFNAYHKYKAQEEKVDQTLVKGINALKKAITGDQQVILIEGKKFSPIGFLKKVLLTVGIFNYSKIAGILAIIVSSVMKGKAKKNEKKKLLMELEEELNMVNEKIEDARGDGNRQAKYDLMRTRNALQNAIKRIKYGIGAEDTKNAYHPERLRSTENYDDSSLRG